MIVESQQARGEDILPDLPNFEIPTLNDVVNEVKRIDSPVSAQRFFADYQSRGWRNKDGSGFDWKAKLAEWGTYNLERSNKEKEPEKKNEPAKYSFKSADMFVFGGS